MHRKGPLLALALAILIAAGFAAYTQHVWEDFYITYRSSKNLVDGHGLVYQVGERVHTFTSPLGVLLPALTLALTGGHSDRWALIGFQALSILAVGGAAAILWELARRHWQLALGPCVVVAGFFLLDAKAVDFAINGMETGFMLLFLALFLRALQTGAAERAWIPLGLAAAGLQWTRPDAFIVGAGAAAGFWIFSPESLAGGTRRAAGIAYVKAALLAGALYVPWLAIAHLYYGSAIPNTVVAKLQTLNLWDFGSLAAWLRAPWIRGLGEAVLPIYHHLGGWSPAALLFGYYAAIVLGHWWILPGADRRGRAVSFAAFLFGLYLTQINLYPWYLPPASLLLVIVLGFALQDLARWLRPLGRWRWAIPATLATVLGVAQAGLFAATARQVKVQQDLIEGQRTRVGLSLREQSRPGDRVFLECVGYIGFNSGLKILDYPGLTAPEVVRKRREISEDWGGLLRSFRPEWVVVRPHEVSRVASSRYPNIESEYEIAGTFTRQKELDALGDFPGIGYLRFDQTFIVLRRRN